MKKLNEIKEGDRLTMKNGKGIIICDNPWVNHKQQVRFSYVQLDSDGKAYGPVRRGILTNLVHVEA